MLANGFHTVASGSFLSQFTTPLIVAMQKSM